MSNENYPEILGDLAAIVGEALVRRGTAIEAAAEVGYEAAEYVRQRWGGQPVYLTKGLHYDLSKRDLEIWRKFNGHNHAELAREHELSVMRIYQILKRVRIEDVRRRQVDLFPKEASR